MSFCHPFLSGCDGLNTGCGCLNTGCGCSSFCPFPDWIHPLLCNPAHFCCASSDNGPTLVIHSILLEPCGNQSCTPRTLRIRVTGPSYPCGELFTLRVGSCTEVDEPLVITNLEPGQYEIEQILSSCREFDTTFTGPICNGCVSITRSIVPTVITIVNRKRFCTRCRRHGCGCGNCGCNRCGCDGCCGRDRGRVCDSCGCRDCDEHHHRERCERCDRDEHHHRDRCDRDEHHHRERCDRDER